MIEQHNKKLLAAMISSALMMTACGGGGGGVDSDNAGNDAGSQTPAGNEDITGNSGAGDDTVTINPYSGSSSISGSVSLSSLSGADSNAVGGSTSAQPRKATRSSFGNTKAGESTDSIVKLYVMAADGELEDTGITCSVGDSASGSSNPEYLCEAIADGRDYVIKYLRLLENNQALEMKVTVNVPEGSAGIEADDVSPQSTVVVDTIVNAVLTATEGKDIDKDIIAEIIASVKEVVKGLLNAGSVQVPSMLVEAPKNDQGEFVETIAEVNGKDVVFDKNENLGSTADVLLSSEEVASEVDAVRVEIEIREIQNIDTQGETGKRELVKKVFASLMGEDDDVPEYIVNFFSDRYMADVKFDVTALFNAISAGIEVRSDEYKDEPGTAGDTGSESESDAAFSVDDLELTAEDSISALQDILHQLYALERDRAAGTLTEDGKKMLSEIPGIIPAIFPADDWDSVDLTVDTVLNVPQGIVFTLFLTDKYVRDVYEEVTGNDSESVRAGEENADGSQEYEREDALDFNPMVMDESGENPGLLQLFGFFEQEHLASLQGVEISHLEVMPDRAWIENSSGDGSGSEKDSLRAHVCVEDLSALAGMGSDTPLAVALKYPTVTGEFKTVALLNQRDVYHYGDDDEGMEQCFTLDPWASKQQQSGTGDAVEQKDDYIRLTEEDLVSDFASGEYTVSVSEGGAVVAERKFNKKVIVGMQNASPKLVTPVGAPQWPAECNGTAYCEKWDQLINEWEAAGGNSTFALNSDPDGDGVEDKAKVTLSWEKPDVDLPDGVKIAYSLDVSSNGSRDNENYYFEHIYSSHDNDRRLFGTSFTLPAYLDKLEFTDGSYQVNVCSEFIDTDNGEFLGSGGCNYAQFNVGDPLDMSAEFTISGKTPENMGEEWKVALIREIHQEYQEDQTFFEPVREVVQSVDVNAEGVYTLSPMIGDFLSGASTGHLSIIMYKDENGDNAPTSTQDAWEPQYWPHWESNIWFETWGRVLRVVSENQSTTEDKDDYKRNEIVITGGEEVTGPDFSAFAEEIGNWDEKPLEPVDEFKDENGELIDPGFIEEGDKGTADGQQPDPTDFTDPEAQDSTQSGSIGDEDEKLIDDTAGTAAQ